MASTLFCIVCNAAAIIDRSSNGDQPFTRANNKTKAQFNETTSVFVRNLPATVSDDDLFQEFQKHGSVINCQVSVTNHFLSIADHQTVSQLALPPLSSSDLNFSVSFNDYRFSEITIPTQSSVVLSISSLRNKPRRLSPM